MAFKKATKSQSKLRLAVCGLAGSGKTFTMLAVAAAMASEMRRLQQGDGKIALIDTEHESASLYADRFDFDTLALDNHSPRAYVDAIREAEAALYDFVIVDSLSHAWAGKNGALEQKDNAAARGGNSWTAWRDITPMHNQLIDTMLACRMHLLASMRTKMEYIQTTANGKTVIEKVGLAAIQREGMEYEFTCVGDIGLDHVLKISKSRLDGVLDTGDAFERPGELFARKVYGWLMSGAPAAETRAPVVAAPAGPSATQVITDSLHLIEVAGTLEELDSLIPSLRSLTGAAVTERNRRYRERKAWLMAEIARRPAEAAATNDEEQEYIDSLQPEAIATSRARPTAVDQHAAGGADPAPQESET